jgi:hypothetical protein
MDARKLAVAGTAVVIFSLGIMSRSSSQTLAPGERDTGLVDRASR